MFFVLGYTWNYRDKPMQYTKNFTELGKDDAPIAGGKGASLGEMTTAGIPVPGGYVVLADTFDAFLKETDLVQEIDAILDGVNHEAIHTVETASESIQALILSRPMPEAMQSEIQDKFVSLGSQYVAVRSSATAEDGAEHAWAGQLDSFLNTTEHDLIEKVRKCWASLFTPRAIFYRFEKGLHTTHISVAVVIQKMVNSEKSGIAFSVHPVTEDYNQLIIEAGFGLGEAIVSGSVTPDSYVVEKSPRNILDINVSHQGRALYRIEGGGSEWKDLSEAVGNSQVLTEVQINELSDIIMRIENHYSFPCDIEWAYEGGVFYIVQSRPITTLSKKEVVETRSIDVVKKIDWQADWEGDFPILPMALGVPAYFSKMQEIFGISISHFLTIHKGVITTGYLPTKEYETFGQGVAKLALDARYLDSWISNFKKSADRVMGLLREGPEVFFQKFQELQSAYDEYGAYQIATKAAYNFLPLDAEEERGKLEEGRKYSETFYHDSTELIEKVAECIAQKHNYSVHEIMSLARKDIESYLKDNFLPSREELLFRWKKSGVLWTSESEVIFSSDEVDYLVLYWDSQINSENLKGDVAYPGKVSGVCRIIKDSKEASLKEGEILITGMTDPNFVPLMKIAKAIVTDSGGLLCHAAIVARELKIPCVIGTKAATKIFKDGDLVEVDADNGVVRILEKVEKLEIGNYQKLFQWPGEFSYFLSSYFMAIYNKHKAISLHDGNMWQSFLPNSSKEETLKSGLVLYSSEQKYNELSKGLTEGFAALADHFEQVLKKDVLTKEDVGSLFDQALEHYNYYSQTEFFFTDLAYAEMNNISQIQKNFETFDELKLRGREYLNKIALAPGCYLDQLLEKIADQLGCDTDSLKCYSINEILELFDGKVMTPDELANRNQYFMHGKGTHTEVLTGSTALGKIRDFFEEVTKTNELKGQTAKKGYYKGVARVFRFSLSEINLMDDEIEKMIKGEILIADTTSPEIILACKKAGAIVTNQGGMMSHAAIVARELNIPCIVGTGHITEIVKTGDLIEVDANSGVVKIL